MSANPSMPTGAPATWREEAKRAGARRPFAGAERRSRGKWQLDAACMGALSAMLASLSVAAVIREPQFFAFAVVSTLTTFVFGWFFGHFCHDVFQQRLAAGGIFSAAFQFSLIGLFWGGLSGGMAGVVAGGGGNEPALFFAFCGAVLGALSGAFQSAWFFPAYGLGAPRRRLVIIAAVLGPGLAWGAFGFLALLVQALLS